MELSRKVTHIKLIWQHDRDGCRVMEGNRTFILTLI